MKPHLAVLLLLFGAAACQEPFAEDRHDLASFRIAGVQAATGADGATALRAAVWSGLGAYHDAVPTLAWSAGDAVAEGQGASMSLDFPAAVDLRASDAAGAAETARLDLGAAPVGIDVGAFQPGVTRRAVDLDITRVADPIADRQAVEPGADEPVPPGGAMRLALDLPDDVTVHWMGSGGQFAELDAHTTDWFAGTATFDSHNVVEATTEADPGVYTLLALAFDGAGNQGWMWMDVAVGLDGPALYTAGRIFPVDAEPMTGALSVQVQQADAAAGIALAAPTVVADSAASPALCGVDAGQPFVFDGLVEGLCARPELVGQTVVVDGEVR